MTLMHQVDTLQAKDVACEGARSGLRAARAAMLTVEQSITIYAQRKEYLKLKDAAEASDLANRVSSLVEIASLVHDRDVVCTSSGGATCSV